MIKKIFYTGVVLCFITGSGLLLHYYSDEQVVRRLCFTMARELGKNGRESRVQLSLKIRAVKDRLASICLVDIPERGYREELDRQLITGYLFMLRTRFSLLGIDLRDVSVEIEPEKQARVLSGVVIDGTTIRQRQVNETYNLEIILKKNENNWRITKAVLPNDLVLIGLDY